MFLYLHLSEPLSKHRVFTALAFLVFGAAVAVVFSLVLMQIKTVKSVIVRGITVRAEVVSEPWERMQGLSGRKSLPAGDGMLFVFPTEDRHGFWMKGMRFSIDIIWIRDKKVIGIVTHAQPPRGKKDQLKVFYPPEKADMALEVNAGFVESYGIKLGDSVYVY